MLKENLSIIARTLVRYGFQRIPGRDPCFEGLIKARGLEFGIRITAIDPSFLKLPIATLVSRPKSLEGLLPHIEKNKTLCYLERLGIFLDPLEPARTTLMVIGGISHYDLVINATGEETFSTLLSHGLHISRKQGKKVPPLLHTWIDAGGRAIRGLIDDGSGACYRCLQIKKPGGQSGELTERYPLFKSSDEEASAEIIHHRCGESFYPFAAGVSSAAAGMVQQMALDALQQSPGARFRHQSLDSSIQNTKDGNPQKIKGCPCCNLK